MITLPPFKSFLASNIPSVYDNTLSYYDELTKLIGYLEQVVVPAINTNSENIDKLDASFKQLKEYVDHYFDNLDVQEEINNKLDDMAESGQLADIIAQYLELAGVLAFDTLADLEDADNITAGSTTRILSKDKMNDGYGAYYKIRALTNTDIIDGDKIIALNNYPALVGEKVADFMAPLGASQGIYLASFFDNNTNINNYLYASQNGKTFKRIGKRPWNQARDADIIYYDNKFYAIITEINEDLSIGELYVSEDLVHWKHKSLYADLGQVDPTYRNYPCDWLVDGDKVYLVGACQVGTMVDDITGNTIRDFRIFIVEVTNMDYDHFTLGTPTIVSTFNYSLYDPTIIKSGSYYYMYAVKGGNEQGYTSGTIQTFRSSDLTSWNRLATTISTLDGYKFEAPSVLFTGTEYIMYIDSYTGTHGSNMHYITSANLSTWSIPKVLECEGYPTRHGSVHKIENGVAEKVIAAYQDRGDTLYTADLKRSIILPAVIGDYQNKYVKIATIKNYLDYRAFRMEFSIKDIENNFVDSKYFISIYKDNSTPTVDMYEEFYVPSRADKIVLRKIDDRTFELYYSTGTYTATPAVIINDVFGQDYDVIIPDEINIVDNMSAGTSYTATRSYGKLSTNDLFKIKKVATVASQTSITATFTYLTNWQSFSAIIFGRNNALMFQAQVNGSGVIDSGQAKAFDLTGQGKTYTVSIADNTVTVSGIDAYDEYTILVTDNTNSELTFSV